MKISISRYWLAMLILVPLAGCGPRAVRFPASVGVNQIQHKDYEALLHRYVNADGDVDYARWQKSDADVASLDQYLGRMTQAPPSIRPELFKSGHDQLSYWINLYNALVVREVVRRWPLASVRDYRPTLSSKIDTTKGFFRDLRFVIGGLEMSLDDIEHKTIRKEFEDARIHFALNCGSASCPILRPKAYSGPELEAELQQATVSFLNSPENVRVDAEHRTLHLSKIFKWYGKDFAKHARRSTGDPKAGVVDFIALFANAELASSLQVARTEKYKKVYLGYDWTVNKAKAAGAEKTASAKRVEYPPASEVPTLDLQILGGTRFAKSQSKAVVLSVWATYCAPCRKTLPHLQSIADKHEGALQVLAISLDDSEAKIEDFLRTNQISLDVAFGDEAMDLVSSLKVTSLPAEIFIDRQGRLRFSLAGAASDKQLDEAVAELLAY
jgi:thiol-disulfide isomerase/thioredoxin